MVLFVILCTPLPPWNLILICLSLWKCLAGLSRVTKILEILVFLSRWKNVEDSGNFNVIFSWYSKIGGCRLVLVFVWFPGSCRGSYYLIRVVRVWFRGLVLIKLCLVGVWIRLIKLRKFVFYYMKSVLYSYDNIIK